MRIRDSLKSTITPASFKKSPQKEFQLVPFSFSNHTNLQQTVDPEHAKGDDILLFGDEALPSPESECLFDGVHNVRVIQLI